MASIGTIHPGRRGSRPNHRGAGPCAPKARPCSGPPALAAGHCPSGFSLLELLASVAIVGLLMGAVFSFMVMSQKRFQGNQVVTESNQSARAALEVMSQEIGQAGANPTFATHKTSSAHVEAGPTAQCITVSDINSIFPGDWLAVDSGPSYEQVEVLATGNGAVAGYTGPSCGANQFSAVFEQCHNDITAPCAVSGSTGPFPIAAYKIPYPSGILQVSDDKTLMFFGDTNSCSGQATCAGGWNPPSGTNTGGSLNYVVYSLSAPAGAQAVTVNGLTYTLYTLYRSSTPVTFTAGAISNPASPMVQNILYNASSKQGPTGQPLFSYTSTIVGIVPNVQTVVGTVNINLCVAVNPESIETNTVQYYDMATQIRPLNLAGAVAVNSSQGGGKYLPPEPQGLPMHNPANYYP